MTVPSFDPNAPFEEVGSAPPAPAPASTATPSFDPNAPFAEVGPAGSDGEPEKGDWGDFALGPVEGGLDLISGSIELFDEFGKYLQRKMPLGGWDLDTGEWVSGEDIGSGKVKTDFGVTAEGIDRTIDETIDRKEMFPWDDVKKAWESGDPVEIAKTVGGFSAEQGVRSIPDMAAAMKSIPRYIWARVWGLAEDTARNDGRKTVEAKDIAQATATAIPTAMMEKFGAKGIVAPGDGVTGILKGGAREAGTEFAQEGLEDVGTTAFTETGVDLERAAERGLAGAVAGGTYGAAGTAAIQGLQKLAADKGEAEPKAETPSAATFDPEQPYETVPDAPDRLELRPGVEGPAGEVHHSATQPMQPGARHIGMVQDRVQGQARAKPLRREKILQPLFKHFGAALYEGRVKGKNVLGFFRPSNEEVRVKRHNDIEVAAHEIAHLLDDRVPEIKRAYAYNPQGNPLRAELKQVSYDQTKIHEGFAEFMRFWATQKNHAQSAAPQFYAWFESFLDRSEHGPALRKAQDDMHAWFAQDGISRMKSKIGLEQKVNDVLNSPFSKFRQRVLDDLDGVAKMEKKLTGKISSGGVYEISRLTRGKHAIVEGALLYGVPTVQADGSHKFVGKGLEQVFEPVSGDIDNFLIYSVARSARELKEQGREKLFSQAEIDAGIALESPEFRRAFEEYQEWNNGILDFAEAKGLIDPSSRARWKRSQYIPFYRVGQAKGGDSKVRPGDWKGIRTLTGGTENLKDVMSNIVGNAEMLISAALTNEARLAVADLAKRKGGGRFMAKIPKEDRRVKILRADMEAKMLKAIGVKSMSQLPEGPARFVEALLEGMGNPVELFVHNQAPHGPNVVAAMRNGKPEYYEVADDLLMSALQHLNRPTKHWLIRLLGMPKRFGQLSITLTADFMAANLARDTLMGTIMSRHGFKPFWSSLRGMKSRIMTDDNYRDFIANGGGFASYMVEEDAFKNNLRKFYGNKGISWQSVINTPQKFVLFLERLADAFEMSTRLGEFERAKSKGADGRHAAYLAREISTDFAMRGDSKTVGFMYDTVMFLKAAVVGMDRLYRGVARDPNRAAIAAKTAMVAAMSMGLYTINRGNPLYEELEDWDRDVHWHFFVPTEDFLEARRLGNELPPVNERYMHFRYPKIWEIGSIGSMAERSVQRFMDDNPGKLGEDFLRLLQNTFKFEYLPQFAAPAIESFANYNRFTQRPIENMSLQSLEPWARSAPSGSPTLRKIGELTRDLPREFQLSPAQMEHLLRGYLNTWALYGLMIADGAAFDNKPSLRIDQYPVIRRFYTQNPNRHTRHVTEFYDTLKEVTEIRRTMSHMDRTNRPELGDELAETPGNLLYDQMNKANEQMRVFNAERNHILTLDTLKNVQEYAVKLGDEDSYKDRVQKMKNTPAWSDISDLKRDLMDLWLEERNQYARTVMEDVKDQLPEP